MSKIIEFNVMACRIKECRLELGLSVEEVSGIMRVKKSVYLSYEAGAKDMKISKLNLLSKLFDVSTDYLLGLTDIKTPPYKQR